MTGARHRLLIEDALEHRRFEDAEADPQPDSDHDDADPERHAPAPVQKVIAGNRAEYEDGDIRDEQSGRSTPLRPRGDEAAMGICFRPLHRDQGRAAPLAADADPLNEADAGQNDRAPDADRGIAGDETDGEGCQTGDQ
jgi:hypothetical protein